MAIWFGCPGAPDHLAYKLNVNVPPRIIKHVQPAAKRHEAGVDGCVANGDPGEQLGFTKVGQHGHLDAGNKFCLSRNFSTADRVLKLHPRSFVLPIDKFDKLITKDAVLKELKERRISDRGTEQLHVSPGLDCRHGSFRQFTYQLGRGIRKVQIHKRYLS